MEQRFRDILAGFERNSITTNEAVSELLILFDVSGSRLKTRYKALTDKERQDLNSEYCNYCFADESVYQCYCAPQYDE